MPNPVDQPIEAPPPEETRTRLLTPLGLVLVFGMAHWQFMLFQPAPGQPPGPLHGALGYVLEVGLWLAAGLSCNRLIDHLLWDGLVSRALGRPVPKLLKDLSGTLVLLLTVTGVVGLVFDQPLSGFWTTSGAVGLVLGFALKNVILDVFIGLATNLDQPYRMGDWIQVHLGLPDVNRDFFGQVLEINWRTTRIRTRNGRVVILPNSVIGASNITNFMQPDPRNRRAVSFYLDPWVDPDRVERLLLAGAAAAAGPRGILSDPEPTVRAAEVTQHGARYDLKYWWDLSEVSPGRARNAVMREVLRSLRAAGLTPSVTRATYYDPAHPAPQLDPLRPQDRPGLLAQVPLFFPLSEEERTRLGESVTLVRVDQGDVLLRRGDPGESMFLLLEGLLEVHIDVGDGVEEKVGTIPPGKALGELSLLTGAPRSATLVAATPALLFEIGRGHLEPLLTSRPSLAESLAEEVTAVQLRDEKARAASSQRRLELEEERSQRVEGLLTKMRSVFSGLLGGRDRGATGA